MIYKYVRKDLKNFIKEIKNESLIKKIKKEFNKIDSISKTNNNCFYIFNNFILIIINKINNNQSNLEIYNIKSQKIDVSPYISKLLLKKIERGNWNEKKEAINYIHQLLFF